MWPNSTNSLSSGAEIIAVDDANALLPVPAHVMCPAAVKTTPGVRYFRPPRSPHRVGKKKRHGHDRRSRIWQRTSRDGEIDLPIEGSLLHEWQQVSGQKRRREWSHPRKDRRVVVSGRAMPNCLRLLRHFMRFAARALFLHAGNSNPISTPMMAMTPASMRVKPARGFLWHAVFLCFTVVGACGGRSLPSRQWFFEPAAAAGSIRSSAVAAVGVGEHPCSPQPAFDYLPLCAL